MSLQVSEGLLEVDRVGAVTVVNLTCSAMLDEETVRDIDEQLGDLADLGEDPVLLLNFSAVRHFGNLLLTQLLRLQKKIEALGGKVALCGLAPDLYEVFEITGLKCCFNILEDAPEAMESFLASDTRSNVRKRRGSKPRPSLPKRPFGRATNAMQPQFAH
jgi:anti-sigma B factor antagonist